MKDEQVLIFGEIVVENEYDPMVPNDFNELLKAEDLRVAKVGASFPPRSSEKEMKGS